MANQLDETNFEVNEEGVTFMSLINNYRLRSVWAH